ncbi:MAG TPA: TIGR03936 family radical SAM-associated protein [Tepidiformaceae bacterium]
MSSQRFRVWFRKGDRVRYISHLDVLRFWERAIRRADLPLAYSQGFTPHPKIGFASPLPLGFIGESEVMDVTLDERMSPEEFAERIRVETSDDLGVIRVKEVSATGPAPQAVLLMADYAVDLPGVDPAEAASVVAGFLANDEFAWVDARKERNRTYDLRAAVATLTAEPWEGGTRLRMRLQADAEMTARPEQVVAALFPDAEVGDYRRTGLLLDEPSAARDAWRRRGRFEE